MKNFEKKLLKKKGDKMDLLPLFGGEAANCWVQPSR